MGNFCVTIGPSKMVRLYVVLIRDLGSGLGRWEMCTIDRLLGEIAPNDLAIFVTLFWYF